MSTNKILIAPVALVTTTMLTGILLSSTITHADGNTSSTDAVSITVDSACTMTGGPTGESTTDNTYTATIDPGTYSEISGSKLVTLCNDSLGYSIYAIGFSGDSYDSNTHTDLIGAGSIGNIQTGTSGTNSYWAMKLEAVQGLTPPTIETGWNDYHEVPGTYAQIAEQGTSTATPSDAGASVQTKYKVNIASSQTAGSYQGKVKYTMVHPNGAPAPTPPTPFETCDTPVPNLTYMQDLNSSNKASILADMQEDQQYFLKDRRDEKSYCVAKLKDGNIWMTQNLDHDIDSTKTYTPTDTDISSNWQPMRSTYATNDTTWDTEGEYGYTSPESYDPGTKFWNGNLWPTDQAICEAAGGTWEDDEGVEYCDGADLTSTTGSSHNHLGNFYNWTAAVAMNDSSSYTTDNQDVNQSICPANWTLPKSGYDTPASTAPGSFQYLVTQYGWDSSSYMMENPTIWNSSIKVSLSGRWVGSLEAVGDYGSFWSPMVCDSYNSYILNATSDGTVGPSGFGDRGSGVSVRCSARW